MISEVSELRNAVPGLHGIAYRFDPGATVLVGVRGRCLWSRLFTTSSARTLNGPVAQVV